MKTFCFKYLIFVSVCIIMTAILLYSPITKTTASKINISYFQVSVCCNNNSYLNNATVCIINNRTYYQTNKNGKTPVIRLQLADSWKKGNYYIVNLLCYKNGYEDYLYFNLKLKPNQKRLDIVINLEEIIDDTHSPTIFFEDPNENDIEQIINEYKKIGKIILPTYKIFT